LVTVAVGYAIDWIEALRGQLHGLMPTLYDRRPWEVPRWRCSPIPRPRSICRRKSFSAWIELAEGRVPPLVVHVLGGALTSRDYDQLARLRDGLDHTRSSRRPLLQAFIAGLSDEEAGREVPSF
jgi:hypothetical protein